MTPRLAFPCLTLARATAADASGTAGRLVLSLEPRRLFISGGNFTKVIRARKRSIRLYPLSPPNPSGFATFLR